MPMDVRHVQHIILRKTDLSCIAVNDAGENDDFFTTEEATATFQSFLPNGYAASADRNNDIAEALHQLDLPGMAINSQQKVVKVFYIETRYDPSHVD